MSWPKGRKNPGASERWKKNNPMNRSEVRAKRSGENSPSKRPEVRAKMRDGWTPERRTKQRINFFVNLGGENHPMKRPEQRERMKKINPMKRPEQRERMKKDNPMKYLKAQIAHKKAMNRPEIREKNSIRMKNGKAAYMNSCNKNPSKEQVQLYEKVKIFYPSAILNYPYQNYSIDIAIPELKIAIEFDGYYWHKGKEDADRKRQVQIEKGGWKFIRYGKVPNNSELEKALEQKR